MLHFNADHMLSTPELCRTISHLLQFYCFLNNQIHCAPLICHLPFHSNSTATLLLLFQTKWTICVNTNSHLTAKDTDTHLHGHQLHWKKWPPFFNKKEANMIASNPTAPPHLPIPQSLTPETRLSL